MADKKLSKFDQWLGKLLYSLIVASHYEDYVCEDANGKTITTPAQIWHKRVLENQR